MSTTTPTDVLTTLDEQWYNAVVANLGLDPNTFQIAQGSIAIGTNSNSIWRFFDAIPPASLTRSFDASGFNSLATVYSGVVNNLIPQTGDALQKLLGDAYVSWLAYRSNPANLPNPLPTEPDGSIDVVKVQVAMFERWGLLALDAATIKAGVTLLSQTDVVSAAQATLLAAQAANKGFAYSATYGALQAAVGRGYSLSFDSSKASSDTSHAWAKGSASGFYDFFSASASGGWDQFDQQLASSGVTLSATFEKVVTLPGQPLATPQTFDPDLASMLPWWSSAALGVAYHTDDNTVWKPGAPTWAGTFGPQGNLQRLTTALVVVDGIDITIETNFATSSEQNTSIEAAAKTGFWPFFSAEGEGGWTHEVSASADGHAVLHSTCPKGNPQVLGATVDPITAVVS